MLADRSRRTFPSPPAHHAHPGVPRSVDSGDASSTHSRRALVPRLSGCGLVQAPRTAWSCSSSWSQAVGLLAALVRGGMRRDLETTCYDGLSVMGGACSRWNRRWSSRGPIGVDTSPDTVRGN